MPEKSPSEKALTEAAITGYLNQHGRTSYKGKPFSRIDVEGLSSPVVTRKLHNLKCLECGRQVRLAFIPSRPLCKDCWLASKQVRCYRCDQVFVDRYQVDPKPICDKCRVPQYAKPEPRTKTVRSGIDRSASRFEQRHSD